MGVLDGVKVIEVAEHGFVPSAAAILADWGADVVKVERPTGDPLRHYAKLGLVADAGDFNFLFEQFNRNKRGVAIDLRNEDGRAVLDRLIEWADVFITNFLPSARAKLRLRHRRHLGVNPRCVYAIGSGQGLRGPGRRARRLRRGVVLGARRDRATCSRRGRAARACRAARSATRRAARTSPAASRPRWCNRERTGERVGRRRVVARRRGVDAGRRPRPDLDPRRRGQARTRPAGARGTVLVGSFRTGDGRWLSLNMLDPERHWEPTCRAPRVSTTCSTIPRTRPRGAHRARARNCIDLFVDRDRVVDARRAEGAAVGGGHHLVDDRVADRGHRRPAGGRERLHAACPGPSDGALVVGADAVRRHRPRDPAPRARDRRAHRRGAARGRRRHREIERLRASGAVV